MLLNTKKIDLHRLHTNSEILGSQKNLSSLQPIVELNTVQVRKTLDVYEHACNITGWQQLYNQISPGQFEGLITEAWLEGIQFFKEYTSKTIQQTCVIWHGALWLGIPLNKNTQQGFIGHKTLTDDLVAIQLGGSEFGLHTPDDFTILGLVIDLQLLEAYFEVLLQRPFPLKVLSSHMTIQVNAQDRYKLCQLIESGLMMAQQSPHILKHPITSKNLRYDLLEALDRLFTNLEPNKITRIKNSQKNHIKIVKKTHEFVMDNAQITDEISITDICEYLQTSRRTLQNAFQSIWKVSPVTYLKNIKLNAVRRELRSPFSEFKTIQDAAMSWGFWHMGQFSADYHALFKELPSQTIHNRMVFY